jgi:hypothetical protein
MFVEIAELYLATLGHTLDDSAEKDVDNSGDVLTLGVKFFRPKKIKANRIKPISDVSELGQSEKRPSFKFFITVIQT